MEMAKKIQYPKAAAEEEADTKKAVQRAMLERANQKIAESKQKLASGQVSTAQPLVSFVAEVETIMIGGDLVSAPSPMIPNAAAAINTSVLGNLDDHAVI
mmetsp:Transcript_52446/g.94494  ORF Transcript_52446/g.94494 Transcript_52446/m.94494 type:complete len:100 (+) Transcript_52446:205-504(+)